MFTSCSIHNLSIKLKVKAKLVKTKFHDPMKEPLKV